MRLTELNALSGEEATREFLRCCGSTHWARAMAAARPFADIGAVEAAADKICDGLGPADWLEAFAAHPRIGESGRSGGAGQADTSEWSRQEQAGASGASDALRERLTARHRDYEARFGYIFIVCASGKRAEEMLAILERRLAHSASDELRAAAQEQRKITHLRIAKLLT